MEPLVKVFLFGSLVNRKGGGDSPLQIKAISPSTVIEILKLLGFKLEEVSLAMVNHKSVPADWPVQPGDRLSLFPREYPIFADWRDHRLNV
jgi:hypothetical protein